MSNRKKESTDSVDPNAAETSVLNQDSPSVNYGTNETANSNLVPPQIGFESAAASEKASLTNSAELGIPPIARLPKRKGVYLLKSYTGNVLKNELRLY